MKIIVGLGNPGSKYVSSRHNVGFRSINQLAQKWDIKLTERRRYATFGEGEVEGTPVVLAKPRTFMNRSGEGVCYLLARFHAKIADVVVIYDEMDLPLGTIRLRVKGSSAGHQGIASIISGVRSQDFGRVRVGIGKPEYSTKWIEYVLGGFTSQEEEVLPDIMTRVGDGVDCWVREGIDAAMNQYNKSESSIPEANDPK